VELVDVVGVSADTRLAVGVNGVRRVRRAVMFVLLPPFSVEPRSQRDVWRQWNPTLLPWIPIL